MALTGGDSTYSVANRLYDRIYAFKDYAGEAERVRAIVEERAPHTRRLLDVACGTGKHLEHLRRRYEVEGADLDPELLAIARERLPGVPLHEADMRTLDLGRRFDAVTCLFSAVGYLVTVDDLRAAARALAKHLEPGGVLVVEPWVEPDAWADGRLHALLVDDDDLKLARLTRPTRDGALATLHFHYVLVTTERAEHLDERHVTRLHTGDEYRAAFEDAGLDVEHDPEGLIGRGLWIGTKPRGEDGRR